MPNQNNYRDMQIMTASPMQLILMLYSECIKSLEKAENAFEVTGPERFQAISNNLLHAQEIIAELTVSLDMEKGGNIAVELERLYDFMTEHLIKANVNKDKQPITEVKELLADLYEAWEKVAEKEPANKAPAQGLKTGNVLAAG